MLKLFYERLKDQTGLGLIGVLLIAGLALTGYSLWSVGTEANKTIQNKTPVGNLGAEKSEIDPSKAREEATKSLLETAYSGGKLALSTVAGQLDDYLVLTVAEWAGLFATDNKNNEEKPKGNLGVAITEIISGKVGYNFKPGTTPQEAKTIVNEIVNDVQKEEINNKNNNKIKIIKLDSKIQDTLKAKEKLADKEIIDLRKALKRSRLSYDYNNEIVKKYKEWQDKGQGITDTTVLEEAKRRCEIANNEIKAAEAKIKELEDAKIVASESEEAKGLTDANKEETKTQPDEAGQEITPDNQEKIITLYGKVWSMFNEKITMTINFNTGEITGSVVGDASLKAGVTGKITLPDNKISVIVTGTYQSSNAGEVPFSYDLIGTYYPETNSASGSNAEGTGKWSASIE